MKRILLLLFILCSINSIGQTFFENKQFGISMQNPTNWNVSDNQLLLKNLEKLDFSNEVTAELIKANKGMIVLASFYKYDINNHIGLIPTITINVRINQTKNFEDFKTFQKESSKGLKKYLDDFEYIIEPKEIQLSNRKGMEYRCKYSMKTKDGEILKIKSLNYFIPIGKYYLCFNFIDGLEKDDCTKEFEELIKTIKIK
ncbi:hypothetical protein [Flavobacterium aciduliphilum]|uniref:DUF1795 domain-containing protein n=1 Tax=Flavobacterium aciduliphilum TaxID=1101402 RepID=A0A328YBT8_9FLAO|nr:hypothetical protein [Flavobacterium aciduliphilum]RAR70674.1 hypothetical protein CLV55_11074 [Flavobacterium aciduliphilum]